MEQMVLLLCYVDPYRLINYREFILVVDNFIDELI